MAYRQWLTEKSVRAAEACGRYYQIFDSEVVAFALAVQPSGTKAFLLNYRVSGRQRRYTIRRWPEWTFIAALECVKELRREMEKGHDPLSNRETPRISLLVECYIEEHVPTLSERNGADHIAMMRRCVKPEWKNRFVEEITPADVERLLTRIAEDRATAKFSAIRQNTL